MLTQTNLKFWDFTATAMIEVIGDEEGSLICYSCDMLLVFFQESLANFFQAAQSLLAVRLPKHFQTYQFFLSFCWCMIWKIIIKKNFWVVNTLRWWVLSSYMLVYSFVPSVLNALTSLLIVSLVTWLSDQLAGKQSNWID